MLTSYDTEKIREYTVMQYPSSKQIRQRTVMPSYWVIRWTNVRVPSFETKNKNVPSRLVENKKYHPVLVLKNKKIPSFPV